MSDVRLSDLMRLIEDHNGLWLGNSDLKYLTITIDTRDANERHSIFDRDNKLVSHDDIIKASKHKYAKTA